MESSGYQPGAPNVDGWGREGNGRRFRLIRVSEGRYRGTRGLRRRGRALIKDEGPTSRALAVARVRALALFCFFLRSSKSGSMYSTYASIWPSHEMTRQKRQKSISYMVYGLM